VRLFIDETRGDPELADVCFEYAAINAYSAWERLRAQPASTRRARRRRTTRRSAATTVAAAVRQNILEFEMPNGKLMRDCTFKEVGKAGRAFARIAAAGRPNQIVGEVLSAQRAQTLISAR
jgi:hypothetical protein